MPTLSMRQVFLWLKLHECKHAAQFFFNSAKVGGDNAKVDVLEGAALRVEQLLTDIELAKRAHVAATVADQVNFITLPLLVSSRR